MVSALVFPGYDGFEAKIALDSLAEYEARIALAVNCFDGSFVKAMDLLVANLAAVSDAVTDKAEMLYYFSEEDAQRVTMDILERTMRWFEENPTAHHVFVTAPFGPRWTEVVCCSAKHELKRRYRERLPQGHFTADVLTLSSSQYTSLYSRGSGVPCVFRRN
jgi:hypothetical protein